MVRFPAVMGVLNVTPDSFSDGGRYFDRRRAVDHALEMAAAGAAIIDIGGESTRPGAPEVPVHDELDRVIPVIKELRGRLTAAISIDTRKSLVARQALAVGADIVNDVSGLTFDPAMAATVASAGAALVVMHMRGVPETMARFARYHNVVDEVRSELALQIRVALRAGVTKSRIVIDPGLGFAKTLRHNLELLRGLSSLVSLGLPVLVGLSRKRFVAGTVGSGKNELLFGTAAANALAVAGGASIIRVHDVAPAVAVARMARAVVTARNG